MKLEDNWKEIQITTGGEKAESARLWRVSPVNTQDEADKVFQYCPQHRKRTCPTNQALLKRGDMIISRVQKNLNVDIFANKKG